MEHALKREKRVKTVSLDLKIKKMHKNIKFNVEAAHLALRLDKTRQECIFRAKTCKRAETKSFALKRDKCPQNIKFSSKTAISASKQEISRQNAKKRQNRKFCPKT